MRSVPPTALYITPIEAIFMSEKTTLMLTKDTRNALAELGRKGDTFETIIKKLIDEHNRKLEQ